MHRLTKTVKILSSVVAACAALLLAQSRLQADPIPFPSGLTPLTSIEYATTPDTNGIRLILGYSTFTAFAVIRSLPSPSDGQMFSDSSIELAAGQLFSDVFVPTDAERSGDFRDFGGPILNPLGNVAFPGNIIPASLLGGIYAFRVGPADVAVPEPASLFLFLLGTVALSITRSRLKRVSS